MKTEIRVWDLMKHQIILIFLTQLRSSKFVHGWVIVTEPCVSLPSRYVPQARKLDICNSLCCPWDVSDFLSFSIIDLFHLLDSLYTRISETTKAIRGLDWETLFNRWLRSPIQQSEGLKNNRRIIVVDHPKSHLTTTKYSFFLHVCLEIRKLWSKKWVPLPSSFPL